MKWAICEWRLKEYVLIIIILMHLYEWEVFAQRGLQSHEQQQITKEQKVNWWMPEVRSFLKIHWIALQIARLFQELKFLNCKWLTKLMMTNCLPAVVKTALRSAALNTPRPKAQNRRWILWEAISTGEVLIAEKFHLADTLWKVAQKA